MQVTVQDNGISVVTDNLSVLAIIKDSLSQSAGSRKIQVQIESGDVEYQAVMCMIDTIYPLVAQQFQIAQKY